MKFSLHPYMWPTLVNLNPMQARLWLTMYLTNINEPLYDMGPTQHLTQVQSRQSNECLLHVMKGHQKGMMWIRGFSKCHIMNNHLSSANPDLPSDSGRHFLCISSVTPHRAHLLKFWSDSVKNPCVYRMSPKFKPIGVGLIKLYA